MGGWFLCQVGLCEVANPSRSDKLRGFIGTI